MFMDRDRYILQTVPICVHVFLISSSDDLNSGPLAFCLTTKCVHSRKDSIDVRELISDLIDYREKMQGIEEKVLSVMMILSVQLSKRYWKIKF